MNSLGKSIRIGSKIVMQGEGSEKSRTVTVAGGFGTRPTLAGTALIVKMPGGTTCTMNAMEIEKLA